VRTTRRIHVTEAGHSLYLKCERIFQELEEVEHSARNAEATPRGHLRIVCTDIMGEQYVARAAAEVCAHNSQLKVDVHVTMRAVDLIAEGYDLAIRYGELNDSSLKARKIYELRHVVCASPSYFERFGRPATIDELKKHNCLVATFAPCATWKFKHGSQAISLDLRGNWRSNSGSALITAAAEGIGICRLPELYVRNLLKTGRLVTVLDEYESDPMPVWMVYPHARYVPVKVRFFIDYFCDNVVRLLAPPTGLQH
jgi:DNA-binding transcriptional LysR family regulator